MSQKVETTRGVPLEFSPFCNPLSLTPVASRTLVTKIWYCRERYKISFLMHTVNRKFPNLLTTPILRALDRKQKFKKTYPRGANPGGEIRKRDFKRGDRRAAGVTLVLAYVLEMQNIPNQLSIL